MCACFRVLRSDDGTTEGDLADEICVDKVRPYYPRHIYKPIQFHT